MVNLIAPLRRGILPCSLAVLAAFSCLSVQAQNQKLTALVGGTLIDGSGGAPLPNSVVLIRGERIERIGTVDTLPVPAGYERISTEGMSVLPGLWDMHVHLLYTGAYGDIPTWHRAHTPDFEKLIMPATAQQLLMAGVTSTRDLGAPPDAILAVRKRIENGEISGPTIYTAGPQITHQPPDWASKYRWGVSGIADAREKVKQLAAMGVNQIKVTDAEGMTPEELKAVADAAHALGLKVAAHGRTLQEIRLGLAAGFDEFEHIGLTEAEYPADLMAEIKKRTSAGKLYWAPTIGLPLTTPYYASNRELADDPSGYRGLPQNIVDEMHKAVANWQPKTAANTAQIIQRKVGQLRDAGVEIIIGTDGGLMGNFHSQALWQEMDAWVRDLGLSPMEAIRRSTSFSAAVMGADKDSGTVSAGKFADVIAVRGDPLRHMNVLREPAVVIRHGQRYK
jgi:imidazolonepropionase-like amidohydrolase